MTPDMKRLCEAAEDAVDQAIIDAGFGRDHSVEAIVRAVLTELREASEAMMDTVDGSLCLANDEQILSPWRSMIDHILAEPATA